MLLKVQVPEKADYTRRDFRIFENISWIICKMQVHIDFTLNFKLSFTVWKLLTQIYSYDFYQKFCETRFFISKTYCSVSKWIDLMNVQDFSTLSTHSVSFCKNSVKSTFSVFSLINHSVISSNFSCNSYSNCKPLVSRKIRYH